jgi:hypothetical protein
MRHWTSVTVLYAPGHDDAFAERLARVLTRQIAVSFDDVAMP